MGWIGAIFQRQKIRFKIMKHLKHFESDLFLNKDDNKDLYNRVLKSSNVPFNKSDVEKIQSVIPKDNLSQYKIYVESGILILRKGKHTQWIEQFSDEWFIIKNSYGEYYSYSNTSYMTYIIDGWDGLISLIKNNF